jgi:hypothetical protein
MNRSNPQKESFLKSLPLDTIESASKKFENISFNFQFFDKSQSEGQDFSGWNHEQLVKLLEKLKWYCSETMEHWKREPIGHGVSHVLEIYGKFPSKSDFKCPRHVPIDVTWGRFRLESDMRLAGFIIDSETCALKKIFPNVFYIVFLDAFHKFYKPE